MISHSKEVILKIAYSLFSQHGFSRTSLEMIANALESPPSIISHHFKSKAALWREVEQFAIHLQNTEPKIRQDKLDNFLQDILTYRLQWYRNETFRKLFQWRSLENEQELRYNVAKPEPSTSCLLNIPAYVKALQKKGLIKKDLEPDVVASLIFSNSSYAILDYINYYHMPDNHLDKVKALILPALYSLLKA